MGAFYEHVPVALSIGAALFLLPSLLWRMSARLLRVPLAAVTDAELEWRKSANPSIRNECSLRTAYVLSSSLTSTSSVRNGGGGGGGAGDFLLVLSQWKTILLYLIYLCQNAVVALTLFVLLDRFLCPDETSVYGVHVLRQFVDSNESVYANDKFPDSVYCNFDIKHQARVHSYVVTCHMPINTYTSGVLLVVWLLLAVAMVMATYSLLYHIFLVICSCQDFLNPVTSTLVSAAAAASPPPGGCCSPQRDDIAVREYLGFRGLGPGGCFVLSLVSNNVNHSFAADVCHQGWLSFQDSCQGKNKMSEGQE